MDRRTTTGNELTIVGWKYKKSLYVTSNCDSSEPMSPAVQRWNKDTQAKTEVQQPFLIDRADHNVATSCIRIKSKKWWWEFFV